MQLSRTKSNILFVAMALVALTQAGCLLVAAGVAGGAALGYAYAQGKVCGAYNARFDDGWVAVHAAMTELGLSIVNEERSTASAEIECINHGGDKVRIDVDSLSAGADTQVPSVRVCVRVGTFGDYSLSEQILNQIGVHLVPAGIPGSVPAGAVPAAYLAYPAVATPAPPMAAPAPTVEPPLNSLPPPGKS